MKHTHKVIYPFIENGKKYWSGDNYESDDKKHLDKLTTKNNKLKRVLIAPVYDTEKQETPVETKKKVDGAPEIKVEETEK